MKATWAPCGAVEFADVKPLPFPLSPAPEENVHDPPVGEYLKVPTPTTGDSNPKFGTTTAATA